MNSKYLSAIVVALLLSTAALADDLELVFVVEVLCGLVAGAHFEGGNGDGVFVAEGEHVEEE